LFSFSKGIALNCASLTTISTRSVGLPLPYYQTTASIAPARPAIILARSRAWYSGSSTMAVANALASSVALFFEPCGRPAGFPDRPFNRSAVNSPPAGFFPLSANLQKHQ
jgi:hypothetical protein